MEGLVIRCPILPNWSMKQDKTCKRYSLCSDERHKICGAKPVESEPPKPYSRSKVCTCKYTTMVPTDDVIIVKGQEKRVYLVVCKECGKSRRTII